MTLTYQLLDGGRGIAVSEDTLYLNGKDSNQLSFLMPQNRFTVGCELYVIMTDDRGQKYTRRLVDGACDLPKALLRKQTVSVNVVSLRAGVARYQWICTPFEVCLVGEACKDVFMLYPELKDIPARLTETERTVLENKNTLDELKAVKQEYAEFKALVTEQLGAIIERHNKLADEVYKLEQEQTL